jgi:hypothetical protein
VKLFSLACVFFSFFLISLPLLFVLLCAPTFGVDLLYQINMEDYAYLTSYSVTPNAQNAIASLQETLVNFNRAPDEAIVAAIAVRTSKISGKGVTYVGVPPLQKGAAVGLYLGRMSLSAEADSSAAA